MITEIPHECAKSKAFTMKLGDLPNMVDAVFDGDHERPGWVHMFANARGCSTSLKLTTNSAFSLSGAKRPPS
jgi:hypothetical protein